MGKGKKTLTVLLSAFIVFIFTACAKKAVSCDELAYKLLNLYDSIPKCSQYVKNSEKYTNGYISPEDFTFIYTGERTRLPEWDLIEEFRLIISDSTEFFEIHIIKVKDSTNSDEIAKLLNRRRRLIELHIAEENDFPIREPILITRGNFIILLATRNNDTAERALRKLI